MTRTWEWKLLWKLSYQPTNTMVATLQSHLSMERALTFVHGRHYTAIILLLSKKRKKQLLGFLHSRGFDTLEMLDQV